MIRSLLATGALMALVCACTPAAENAPAPADNAASDTASAADLGLPEDATGFITANPLPLDPEGKEVRRDDYGRPYEYALLGEQLPHLTGTMMDGTPFDSDSINNWTVIDVWGIWCGDCMADAPYVAALASAIDQDPDLDFLSIHTPASAARATPEDMFGKYGSLDAYFASKGYSYPVLVDPDASLRETLKITWTPSYILVSPDGVVKGYRSEFSAAGGEAIKDFMKDIARVKAETKKTDLGGLRIGPEGVAGLPENTPFTLDAVEAAFPDHKIQPIRLGAPGDSHPAFEVREGHETLLTLSPDWSLASVGQVSTTSPRVAGPNGERIGSFPLTEVNAAGCTPEQVDGHDRMVCADAAHSHFLRIFTLDDPAAGTGTLAEMSYTFQGRPVGE